MRVTVDQTDYAFKLLNWDAGALKVELDGGIYHLKREGRSWVNAEGLEPQLAEAIGKSVALRYRI